MDARSVSATDGQLDMQERTGREHRSVLALLVGVLVLLRGLMLISVLPPLEGWDEYQHVGYVQFVAENGRPPVIGRDHVPQTVLDAIANVPQPRHAVEQLGQGAVGYEQFWQGVRVSSPAKSQEILLYQAQHPALYYLLVQGLWRATGGVAELSTSIAALRLANVVLAALAAGLLAISVSLFFQDRWLARAAGLLLSLHPLFLLAGARVSNDALAIALGAAGLACLGAYLQAKRNLLWGGAAGMLLGASVCARATSVAPLLAAGAAVAWVLLRRRSMRELMGAGVFVIAAGLAVAPLVHFNLSHYGTLLASAEAMENAALKRSWGDLWAAAMTINWPLTLYVWFGSFWIGGWSFLRAPLVSVIVWMAGSFGLGIGLLVTLVSAKLRGRLRGAISEEAGGVAFSLAVVGSFAASMVAHTVIARAASGSLSNPWYAALAIPFTLALALLLAKALLPRGVRWVAIAAALLFLMTEMYCTLVRMPRVYGGDAGLMVNLQRMGTLRPVWLGMPTLMAAGTGAVVLAIGLIRWAAIDARSPERALAEQGSEVGQE